MEVRPPSIVTRLGIEPFVGGDGEERPSSVTEEPRKQPPSAVAQRGSKRRAPATEQSGSERTTGFGAAERGRHGKNGRSQSSGGEGSKEETTPVGGERHQGRVLALQVLFEVDLAGHDHKLTLEHTLVDQAAPPPLWRHVERLVTGVLRHQSEIDPYIVAAATAFPLPQLAAVDRSVLRLAVYEMLHERDVPIKVAINEAVELAKRFGGDNSGRFVNGVLGTIAERLPVRHTVESQPTPPPPAAPNRAARRAAAKAASLAQSLTDAASEPTAIDISATIAPE